MGNWQKLIVGMVLAVFIGSIGLLGCGGGGGGGASCDVYTGTIYESGEPDVGVTMSLCDDGTLTGNDADGSRTGTYSISGNSFSATLNTSGGEVVTVTGTVSGDTITGNWASSDGEVGTFDVTK